MYDYDDDWDKRGPSFNLADTLLQEMDDGSGTVGVLIGAFAVTAVICIGLPVLLVVGLGWLLVKGVKGLGRLTEWLAE